MRREGATHVAMEVSSIALVLRRVAAVRFRVAAFTNLTQDHLDFHGSMEDYARAKLDLFTTMGPGLAVVNVDDPFGANVAGGDASGQACIIRVRRASRPTPERPTPDVYRAARGLDERAGDAHHRAAPGFPRRCRERHRPVARGSSGRTTSRTSSSQWASRWRSTSIFTPRPTGSGPSAARRGASSAATAKGTTSTVLVDYAHTPDALARVLDSVRAVAGRSGSSAVFGCGGTAIRPEDAGRWARQRRGRADALVITNDNPRSEEPAAIAAPIEEGGVAAGRDARDRSRSRRWR